MRFEQVIIEGQNLTAAARLIRQNARSIRREADAYPGRWLCYWNGRMLAWGSALADVRKYRPPVGPAYHGYRPEDRVFVRTGGRDC